MDLHATPIEWAWCAAAGACLLTTAENSRQAWRDWRANRHRARLFYLPAVAELESQGSFMVVQAVFLAIGVGALFTPEPTRPAVDTFSTIASAALVLCEVILAARSIRVRWRRHQLDATIEAYAGCGGYRP